MRLSDEQTGKFLLVLQGIGAIFIVIFLAAYLAGLPSTNVLHSEPTFRIPLAIFGIALLAMTLLTIAIASTTEKD